MTSHYGFSRWSAAGLYVVSIPKLRYAATKKKKPNRNSEVTVTHLKEEVIAFRRMAVKSSLDQIPSAQTFVLDR